jgi:hypothetical protein
VTALTVWLAVSLRAEEVAATLVDMLGRIEDRWDLHAWDSPERGEEDR